MKTILLTTAFLLIAWSGYSQTDSVTISTTVANNIYRELEDCKLVKLQYITLQQADSLQGIKLRTLEQIIVTKDLAQTELRTSYDTLLRKNKKLHKQSTFWKILTGVAFIGGVVLGSG